MFIKYISIENSYRQKYIKLFLEHHPELVDEIFIITEKLHGANICLEINKTGLINICSRNRILTENEKFFDVQNVIKEPQYEDLIEQIRTSCILLDLNIHVYGEIIGPGVNKGIDYGKSKQIRFFDMRIDKQLIPQKEFFENMEIYGTGHLTVPIIKKLKGLQNALDYENVFNSKIINIDDNICEGTVIKPYEKIYYNAVGSIFYLKNKTNEFKEKSKRKKRIKKDPIKMDPKLINLHEEFMTFITENRLKNIFSKYGEIDDHKNIGKYIKYMLNDAIEDFIKDNDITHLNKKDNKYVINGGPTIVKMLQKYL